jgi:hypothetical protein
VKLENLQLFVTLYQKIKRFPTRSSLKGILNANFSDLMAYFVSLKPVRRRATFARQIAESEPVAGEGFNGLYKTLN